MNFLPLEVEVVAMRGWLEAASLSVEPAATLAYLALAKAAMEAMPK
nr:hypothetical protein [uncultured Halomonas sp.]